MNILICANTIEIAKNKLMDIMDKLPNNCIESCEIGKKSNSHLRVKNGDKYITSVAQEGIRSRFHKIYVHNDVDEKFVNFVLMPMLAYVKFVDRDDVLVRF